MKSKRKILKEFGNTLLKANVSLISGIVGIIIVGIFTVSEPFRKVYLEVSIFNLGIIPSVVIETIILTFIIIIFWALAEVFFKRVGSGIIWISEHKQGNPIAKTNLSIAKLPLKDEKSQQEFIVSVKNNENSDVYNAVVSFVIFGPINSKNGNQTVGNLNGFWIRKKDDNKDDGLDGEYRPITIPSGNKRDLFFVKTSKKEDGFSIKILSGEIKFPSGRYILKILLYGEMATKQVRAEKSGEMVCYDNGQVVFDLKKVKQKRGFISLVERKFMWDSE